MLKKIHFTTLFVLVAMSATACAQLQLPTSLPQIPNITQPGVSSAPSTSNAPDQSTENAASTAPGSQPQVGQNGKGGNAKRAAALLQLLKRAGWDAGVITRISSDQITLRTIEPPGLQNNPGQNQPNPNSPNQNQPGQRHKATVETVNVNGSTIIIVPGKANATLSDLRVGDRVIADVPNGQKFAALILNAPKDFDKDNVTLGQVIGNNSGTLTLRAPGGGDTVNTTATTQVFKLAKDGVKSGLVSDLTNGNLVVAVGAGTSDQFTAQVIFALPQAGLNLGGGKKNFPPQQPQQNQGR